MNFQIMMMSETIMLIGAVTAGYFFLVLLFILLQPKFLFHPQKLKAGFSYHGDHWVEEINLKTKDKATINSALVNSAAKKGLIIYYHGNMKHLWNYFPYIRKFSKKDFAVLMMDYRSFGKSTGRLTEKNFFADAEMVFDYAEKNFPGRRIIIYGRSMGAAAATYVASRRNCDHLILEAPFFNLYDLARRFWMLVPNGNYLKFGFRNDLHLQNVKSPITIFHGTRDTIVPYRSGAKLKPFLKSNDQFITIKGGRHNNLEDFEQYENGLNELLK